MRIIQGGRMLAAVVGGNLQGIEAAYLAHKAGWEIILVDRRPNAPASQLCDQFVHREITAEDDLKNLFRGVDLVIPALENKVALECLDNWSRTTEIPLAFDFEAFAVSSSKLKSDRLFHRLGVPAPLPWPDCDFPLIIKPSVGSGSRGVKIINDSGSLNQYLDDPPDSWVLQEYVEGPSYSIEVLGLPGQYSPLQVTDLQMDAGHDCKRVLAPTDLSEALISNFEQISLSLAEALKLRGLMDVEVILHQNVLRVLEIDARLPSQTPTAVFWSSGLNMIEMLGELFLNGAVSAAAPIIYPKGVVYEHIKVSPDLIEVGGEHIISGADGMHLHNDFFGADEAITNYKPGRDEWVATLIICEQTRETAWEKRKAVISGIQKKFKPAIYRDSFPLGLNF